MSLIFYIATQIWNKRMQSIFEKFSNVAKNFLTGRYDCSRYFLFMLLYVRHRILILMIVHEPPQEASREAKPGDFSGQPAGPYIPTQVFGNISSKIERTTCVMWGSAPPCRKHLWKLLSFWLDANVQHLTIIGSSDWFKFKEKWFSIPLACIEHQTVTFDLVIHAIESF